DPGARQHRQRGRSLHRVAGPGARLQDGRARDPAAARRRGETDGGAVRPEGVPRSGAGRRRGQPAGAARAGRGLDRGQRAPRGARDWRIIAPAMRSWFVPILQFWFGDVDALGRSDVAHSRRWFMKDAAFDREIADRFGETYADVRGGLREAWLDDPR